MTRIRIVEQAGSTNAELIADRAAVEGDWLVALDQTAGRGRQGRSWIPAKGNFYGSCLVELRPDDPPAQSLSLAAGLAVIEAIDATDPTGDGPAVILKWPNDVLLLGRKLAGILLERSGDRVAAGFGVNLTLAPHLEGRAAAALDGKLAPAAFAPLLAASFTRLLALWRDAEPSLMAQAWLARAHPPGTMLTVHKGPGETVSGRFDGIESDGALRLRTTDGELLVVRAGDVDLA
ncbi:MAG: biotin--[acetyl-CoA-carboxylase] ligase [Sphingomicrobium sp.]